MVKIQNNSLGPLSYLNPLWTSGTSCVGEFSAEKLPLLMHWSFPCPETAGRVSLEAWPSRMWHSGPGEVTGGCVDSHSQQHPLSYVLSTRNVLCFPGCIASEPTIQLPVYTQHESKTAVLIWSIFFTHWRSVQPNVTVTWNNFIGLKLLITLPWFNLPGFQWAPPYKTVPEVLPPLAFKIKFFKILVCSNPKTEKPMQAVWLLGACVLFLSLHLGAFSILPGWVNWE